jgi:HK97 family phage portal protein
MAQAQRWYNEERVRQSGSVVLRDWLEQRPGAVDRVAPHGAGGALAVRNDARYKLSDREAMADVFGVPANGLPPVTPTTAMQVTAVYACCTLLAGAQSILPLNFFERVDSVAGRKRIKHDYWWLFNEQPSPLIPAGVYWEYIGATRLLQGDAFALLVRNRAGTITESLPLSPLECTPRRVDSNTYVYVIQAEDLNGGAPFAVHQDDMLHFHGFGWNPHTGRSKSVIGWAARQAIGTALAADQYSGKFFSNGAQPSHVISYKTAVKGEAIEALRERWAERTAGLDNAHRPLVLTHGAELKELSIKPEDAQLMEARRFQVEDIARAFGVPPFMIGHLEKTTSFGAGVEQMGMGFIRFTLMRYIRKDEQEINRKAFRTEKFFAEFLLDALQRGDLKARGDYYRQARGGSQGPGWMNADEIRALENLEPIGGEVGGEIYRGPAVAAKPAKDGNAGGGGGGDGGDEPNREPKPSERPQPTRHEQLLELVRAAAEALKPEIAVHGGDVIVEGVEVNVAQPRAGSTETVIKERDARGLATRVETRPVDDQEKK